MTQRDSWKGVAAITVDESGQNEIIVIPGANGLLDINDVTAAGIYPFVLCDYYFCLLSLYLIQF